MYEIGDSPLASAGSSKPVRGRLVVTIRDFTPDDYQAVSDLNNALYPERPSVPEDWREIDEQRDAKCKHHRWVVEHAGQVVGMAQYAQNPWLYDPQRFAVLVRVHPEHQGRGIGTTLYQTVMTALAPFQPTDLRARVREDHPHAVRFVQQRGYVEELREQRSVLDLATFDPAPFAGILAQVADAGITIKSLADLADVPDRDERVHALDMLVSPDEPGLEDFTPLTLEQYQREVIQAPTFSQQGSFIAITAAGEYVGLSFLWSSRASDDLDTGFTAVRREYRRQRIATALKVHALSWAKANGNSRVITGNADTNPMLQLNYRLGFRPTPAWIAVKRQLGRAMNKEQRIQ